MASSITDDFENDWTFVDREGKVDIEPRKNSVSYSKSLPTRDEVLVTHSEVPVKDDSEGEAEFEVLSGFQCQRPPEEELTSTQGLKGETEWRHASNADLEGEVENELVPIQLNCCQCAADDGIMIISNHFCLNEDADTTGTIKTPLASECDSVCNQEVLLSSNISTDTADGWRELPQLSESGSFSFPSDLNGSEEENDIEPIPEEDNNQDFVELTHEEDTLEEMVESGLSVFSFDSDLFDRSDSDEDVDNEEDHSDIIKLTEVSDDDKDRDLDAKDNTEETEDHLMTTTSHDGSSFYVDVPTLFVLLGVTTALGFTIGYGLSVYISSQALEVSGNIKRPGPKTASLPLISDPMEPLDEVSRDFLDQLTMWKLEDRLDPQKDQEPGNELGDLFDTKALHEKLQQKHFKLMSLHESLKQRLRMSKVMSWYWRLKYEEERSKEEGGGKWNKALQEQLEHMEQLYLHEKHTADLWRRMNENTKLRRAVANGIKFDKYWKDFLHRWKKDSNMSPVGTNESQALPDSTEPDEKPEESAATKAKGLEPSAHNSARMRDSTWSEFRKRWTKDSKLNGRKEESSSNSRKCASDDSNKKNDLSVLSEEHSVATLSQETNVSPLYSPVFVESSTKKSIKEASTKSGEGDKTVSSLTKDNKKSQDKNNGKEFWKDFKKGRQFDNPLFPRDLVSSWFHDTTPPFLKADPRERLKLSAEQVTPKETYLKEYRCPLESSSDVKKVPRDVLGEMFAIRNVEETKKKVMSYQEFSARKKCEKGSVVQNNGPLTTKNTSETQDEDFNYKLWLRQSLAKQKQMLRNLSQHRGEEIRKHRIQRRELKKKEKEAKLRVEEADRYLLELKQERRRIEIEKRKLRRSWKALKRDKKKFSLEKEVHNKDRKRLEKFTATLKEEKQRLKKLKVRLKKMKELLAKEVKSLKLKKKTLDAEKQREVEGLRSEIEQEKDKLRKQKGVLKSLKKAAREEYKKWLKELRKMKEKEKERQEAEREKQRNEAKKKWKHSQRERLRTQEYESVIQEQAKYDNEKRRKKGESGQTEDSMNEKMTREEWEKTDENMKEDEYAERRGSERKTEGSYREDFFRQQLDNVKEWLSNVHKKTLERQQKTYSQMEYLKQWLSSVHKKTLKQAKQFHWGTLFAPTIFTPNREAETSKPKEDERVDLHEENLKHDKKSEGDQDSYRKNVPDDNVDNSKQSDWETEKQVRKLMSGMEKRECERKENEKWEMIVKNSELTRISEDRALAGFVNLTFDVDLVKTLLKGLDKQKRKGKTSSDDAGATDSRSFIIVSKEETDISSSRDSDVTKKKARKKPKRPHRHRWMPQGPMESEDSRMKSEDWNRQETPQGPIPPEGVRMSSEEWYVKRHKAKTKGKIREGPRGPILSEGVRAGEDKTRKSNERENTQGKVCTSDEPETRHSIPPPEWVFQRARERAKTRAEQQSVPWYDMRAQDRYIQRSTDQHDTQFLCGHIWELHKDQRCTSWYDQRAQDRCSQRNTDKHDTHFPSGTKWKHRADQQSVPWYDRRAQDRYSQRSTDKHQTQFPCGQKRKRSQDWFFERARDRASQRSNHFPWYFQRAEGRESQRGEGLDEPWFLGGGHFRDYLSDWMPQGPSMDEHP